MYMGDIYQLHGSLFYELTVEGVVSPPLLPVVEQQLRGEHHGPYGYHGNHHRQAEEELQMGKHRLEVVINTCTQKKHSCTQSYNFSKKKTHLKLVSSTGGHLRQVCPPLPNVPVHTDYHGNQDHHVQCC